MVSVAADVSKTDYHDKYVQVRLGSRTVKVRVSVGEGTGTPVLLLMGYDSPDTVWGALRDLLHAQGYSTICVDVPEVYAVNRRLATMEGLARFWVRCLDQLGTPKVHLIGWSWGVYAALQIEAAHPERVDRMVLLAPPDMFLPVMPSLPVLAYLSFSTRGEDPHRDAHWLYGGDVALDPLILLGLERAPRPGVRAVQGAAALAAMCRPVMQIHHPTLVMYSHDDPLALALNVWRMSLRWNGNLASFVEAERGGHTFPATRAVECVRVILLHLAGEPVRESRPSLFASLTAYFGHTASVWTQVFVPWL